MNNPLTSVLPTAARRYLYAALFVIGIAASAWLAAQGDWLTFATSLTGSLISALAGSNVTDDTTDTDTSDTSDTATNSQAPLDTVAAGSAAPADPAAPAAPAAGVPPTPQA